LMAMAARQGLNKCLSDLSRMGGADVSAAKPMRTGNPA